MPDLVGMRHAGCRNEYMMQHSTRPVPIIQSHTLFCDSRLGAAHMPSSPKGLYGVPC